MISTGVYESRPGFVRCVRIGAWPEQSTPAEEDVEADFSN